MQRFEAITTSRVFTQEKDLQCTIVCQTLSNPFNLILIAALTSLSWRVLHCGHLHCRTFNGSFGLFLYLHLEHSCVEAKNVGPKSIVFPTHFVLYSNCLLNSLGAWFSKPLFNPALAALLFFSYFPVVEFCFFFALRDIFLIFKSSIAKAVKFELINLFVTW